MKSEELGVRSEESAATGPVLEARGLAVGYRGEAVLKDLDFACEAGRFVSLLGPNGVGKTTLLRTLSRHLPALAGEVFVMGRPLAEYRALDLARIMAVVLTEKITPPLLTVREFVALGRYPHTGYLGHLREHDRERVAASLAAVRAGHLAERQFSDLSDGERQKALIARALAQEPRLLFLDEPTIHLDLKHRIEVMAILRELCRERGITVLASLHDVDVAAKVSDRVLLVKDKGISAGGSPETVLDAAAVSRLYDMDQAVFDSALGGLEILARGHRGRAFVAGGMGHAASVCRMLAKKGFTLAAGILEEHDLDCHVALALGADCARIPPLAAPDEAALERARALMLACDFVVDSGFPFAPEAPLAQANAALAQEALAAGKTVFSLRPEALPGAADAAQVRLCPDADAFLRALDSLNLREADR